MSIISPVEGQQYKIITEAFEGPFELLLHLIKEQQVDVHQISIELIAQQFLDYLATCDELNINLAAEFLSMAARLMFIKSSSLLPDNTASRRVQNSTPPPSPAEELIEELAEYQAFKQAAALLAEKQQAQQIHLPHHPQPLPPQKPDHPTPLAVTTYQLVKAFQNILQRQQQQKGNSSNNPALLTKRKTSLQQHSAQIIENVQQSVQTSFSDYFSKLPNKQEMITSFLALLELVKCGEITLFQDSPFGEIILCLSECSPTNKPPSLDGREPQLS